MKHVGHSITKCAVCDTVINQCRCTSPNKTVLWDLCLPCAEKPDSRAKLLARLREPVAASQIPPRPPAWDATKESATSALTPAERYRRDAMFRHLVDQLYLQIREARYTPTEIREAAMLAQMRYEDERPRAWVMMPGSSSFVAYDPRTSSAVGPSKCPYCPASPLDDRGRCPRCGARPWSIEP